MPWDNKGFAEDHNADQCPREAGMQPQSLRPGSWDSFQVEVHGCLSLILIIQTLKDLPSIFRLLLTFLGDLIIAAVPILWVKSEGQ